MNVLQIIDHKRHEVNFT